MTDVKNLTDLIANQGDKPLIISSEAENIKAKQVKQELKKDWVFFIVRDVIVFAAVVIFVLTVGMYSLLIVFRGAAPENEKEFAIAVISMIMTGLIIFVTARSTVSYK